MIALRLFVFVNFYNFNIGTFCPDRCVCLSYADYTVKVNCSASEITKIPYGINPQVTVLDLSHNDIKSYSHSKYLKSVEEIDLSNNQITEVSFGGSFKNLFTIDLSHNSIANLNKIEIVQLKNLYKLNLSHNSKLHEVSGLKSESLKILNLSHCYVSYLNEDFLMDLPKIQYLDLSYNPIKSLKNARSHSLQNLDASHLNVDSLNKMDVLNLPGLKILNVSHNKNIKMIFSIENYCWNINSLDVSNSASDYLYDFHPFCNLKILNASLNQIEIIEVKTFINNVNLNFLNLSLNKITDIEDGAFLNNENLKIVDLSLNKIHSLLFTYHLKQTIDLNLSYNQITTINGLILKNCIKLNLSNNKINEIKTNLNERAPKLKIINLSFNKIKHVGEINSKSINYIDLSYNKIEFVDFRAFDNSDNLYEINLTENKLKILDYRTFNELNSLKNLWLIQNPWSCDCFTRDFKELYEFLIVVKPFNTTDELKCVKTNKTWNKTCHENWKNEKEYKKTIYILMGSLAITLVVVSFVFLNKFFVKNRENVQIDVDNLEDGNNNNNNERYRLNNQRRDSLENFEEGEEEISRRSSTPPPNYETAILLPKLTENGVQEESVISRNSLVVANEVVQHVEEENQIRTFNNE